MKVSKDLLDFKASEFKILKKTFSDKFTGNDGLTLPAEIFRLFELIKLFPDLNALPYYYPDKKDAAEIAKTSQLAQAIELAKNSLKTLESLASACCVQVTRADKKVSETVNNLSAPNSTSRLAPSKLAPILRSRSNSLSAASKHPRDTTIDLTPQYSEVVNKKSRTRKDSTASGKAVISGDPLRTFAVTKPAAVKVTVGKESTNDLSVVKAYISAHDYFKPHIGGAVWDFLHDDDHSVTYRLAFKNWPQGKDILNPSQWPVGLNPKKWNGEIYKIDPAKMKATRTFRIGGPMLPPDVTPEKMRSFLAKIAATDGMSDLEALGIESTNHTIVVQDFVGKGKNLDPDGNKKFSNFVAKISTVDGSALSDSIVTFFERHPQVHIHNWSGPLPNASAASKRSKLTPFAL